MFHPRYGTEWNGVVVVLILFVHVGCHSYDPEAVRQSNKERFWPEAAKRMQEFAGISARNCGVVNREEPGQANLIKNASESASECALRTDAAKQSFFVFYRGANGEGVVRTEASKFYRVSVGVKRGARDEDFGPDVKFEECSSPLLLAAEGGYLRCVDSASNPLREVGGRWCVISKALLPLSRGGENKVQKTLKESDCYASLELARQEQQRQEAELLEQSQSERRRRSDSLDCTALANLVSAGTGSLDKGVEMYRDCKAGRVPIMNLGNK
jgi:hypothetical protein